MCDQIALPGGEESLDGYDDSNRLHVSACKKCKRVYNPASGRWEVIPMWDEMDILVSMDRMVIHYFECSFCKEK